MGGLGWAIGAGFRRYRELLRDWRRAHGAGKRIRVLDIGNDREYISDRGSKHRGNQMPEFHIDFGSDAAYRAYRKLDSFTQGYIEAMFFTESGGDGCACDDKSFSDLAPETLKEIIEDCESFQGMADGALRRAYKQDKVAYDAERAGNDFWYTRNGHGVGFWDRGLGVVGTCLTKLAKTFTSQDVYLGDDGKIYV